MAIGAGGFGDAVGHQDQLVVRLQLEMHYGKLCAFDHAQPRAPGLLVRLAPGHDGIFDDCRHNRIETTQRLLSTIVTNHSMKLSTVGGFATTTCFI
jgi:hypothetical protein